MNLEINRLYEWLDTGDCPVIERILAYLPNSEVATINVNSKTVTPSTRSVKELEDALAAGNIRVLSNDPWSHKNRPEGDITPKDLSRRDGAWDLIRPIVESPTHLLFDKRQRWALLKAQQQATGKRIKIIYDALRKYWIGGQIKNALLPDYNRGDRKDSTAGRKGQVNLTTEDYKKFELGIKAFYEKATKPTLRDAYRKTIARYFNTGYLIKNGTTVPQLPPSHSRVRIWASKSRRISPIFRSINPSGIMSAPIIREIALCNVAVFLRSSSVNGMAQIQKVRHVRLQNLANAKNHAKAKTSETAQTNLGQECQCS